MDMRREYFLWAGLVLVGASLVLVGASFVPGWAGRSDPAIIFLSLAAASVFCQYVAPPQWFWRDWLFVSSLGFGAFGVVFLLNALSNDWSSWAYAWLLCIAGLAAGAALAIRANGLAERFYHIAVWVAAGSTALSAIFGVIASGPFMRIFSILLLGAVAALFLTRLRKPGAAAGAEAVEAGGRPLDSGAANQGLVEPLSKRELEVLQWIDQGLSNAEIADRMVVAQSTVKTHINNIYTKLGVQTRTQAVRRARELGLF